MPFWFNFCCCCCCWVDLLQLLHVLSPPPSSTPHLSGTQKSLIFHLGFEMHVMLLPDLGCVWFMWRFAFQATLSVKKAGVVVFVHVVVFSFFPGENIDIFGIWVFNSSFYLFIWLCIWHVWHSFSLLEQECEFCLSCQFLFIVNHHRHHQYHHDNDKTNSNMDICVTSCL